MSNVNTASVEHTHDFVAKMNDDYEAPMLSGASPLKSEDEMADEFRQYLLETLEVSLDIGDGQIDKAQLAKMIEAIDVEVGVALLDPEDEGVGYRNLVRSRSEVHGTVSISVGIPHDLPYPDEVLEVINDDPFQPGEVPDVTTSNYKTISTPSEGNDLQNTMKSVVGSMVAIYDESAGVLSNEQLIALLTEEISDIVTKYDFVKMLPESTSIDANDVGDVAYKACIANKLEKLYPKKIPTVEAPGDDETSGTTISRKP